jgi:hypothetical protein
LSKITQEQIKFLQQHNISLGAVFDATGLGPKAYGAEMKALGKAVAFGVTPCKKGGHSLRSRSGSCIVCEPAFIAFQSRYEEFAYVYIAGSRKLKLIKAGFASDTAVRLSSLNELGYGGTSDWEILFWLKSENAGRLEFNLHSELSEYAAPSNYQREGKRVDCMETFSCGAFTAIKKLKSLTGTKNAFWINDKRIEKYNFKNVKNKEITHKGKSFRGKTPNRLSFADKQRRKNEGQEAGISLSLSIHHLNDSGDSSKIVKLYSQVMARDEKTAVKNIKLTVMAVYSGNDIPVRFITPDDVNVPLKIQTKGCAINSDKAKVLSKLIKKDYSLYDFDWGLAFNNVDFIKDTSSKKRLW